MSQSYSSVASDMPRATVSNQRPSSLSTTSSAFSPYAYPNEDWTKISDLAERRRIQNRIAQRNYRQKLKRRLEDLERRAHSTSTSPEPAPKQKLQQRPPHNRTKSHSDVPTKINWVSPPLSHTNHQSPTPSLRDSLSSFDEEIALSHYGYGLSSPVLDRSSLPSYPLAESASNASYAQEPWYSNSTAPVYTPAYQAWNAPTIHSIYNESQAIRVKEEQKDEDFDHYGYAGNTSSIRGSECYQDPNSQSYTPSLSDSLDSSFPNSLIDSPHLLGTYPTPSPSAAADDTFFASGFAQAMTSADDPFLLTPAYELDEEPSMPFLF